MKLFIRITNQELPKGGFCFLRMSLVANERQHGTNKIDLSLCFETLRIAGKFIE
jgi:hypothetical protein